MEKVCLATIASILVLGFSVQVDGSDECFNYKFLNESNRAETYYRGKTAICDKTLSLGWYRFGGKAGNQMPEYCVNMRHCGTNAPGWLNGTHPSVVDGAVKRKVCFHSSSKCCRWSTDIEVRNCGRFYLYKLQRPPHCDLRYCGNGTSSERECSSYKYLNESNRAETYKPPGLFLNLCDTALSGWYRFGGEAGYQMPESCVKEKHCGTFAPGWLKGSHPSVADGAVERKVCFHWSSWTDSCCLYSTYIKVRNCKGFYVYKLESPPRCALRYCGNGLPAPVATAEPVTLQGNVGIKVSDIRPTITQTLAVTSTIFSTISKEKISSERFLIAPTTTASQRMNDISESRRPAITQTLTDQTVHSSIYSTLYTQKQSTERPLVDDSTSALSFKITLGLVVTFVFLVLVAIIVIVSRRVWQKKERDVTEVAGGSQGDITMLEITSDTITKLRDQELSTRQPSVRSRTSVVEDEVVDNEMYLQDMEINRNWEIPRERLKITEEKLGEGEFGVVRKGIYLRKDGKELPVAVKMLKDNSDQSQRLALIQELQTLMKVGRHSNIVSLVGACSFEEPLCVVVEFVPGGSLDKILCESRVPVRTEDSTYVNILSSLSERELLRIASDVSNGMRHLESKLCVHRDLAARNVLVGKGLVAKVADFGLARDVSRDGEYIKCTEGKVPWLWMSMESLRGIYTTMSDVWSFGVVLWEIVTLGERPYRGITGIVELHTMLQDGIRLEKPPHCSEELYDIMLQCWQESPGDRPTFKDLHSKLHMILNQNTITYINVQYFKEQKTVSVEESL